MDNSAKKVGFNNITINGMKKILCVGALAIALPIIAFAATYKFTFNNAALADGSVVEIEATVKNLSKNNFTRCDYWSDNYIQWLGYYSVPSAVSIDATAVKDFCVSHFSDKKVK